MTVSRANNSEKEKRKRRKKTKILKGAINVYRQNQQDENIKKKKT
jgi:hypothetical protein